MNQLQVIVAKFPADHHHSYLVHELETEARAKGKKENK